MVYLTLIGVLSDTHIPWKTKSLPHGLIEGLKGVDMIIHAGDITRDYVIYELEEIAPVVAVAGNNDDEFIQARYGIKKIIKIEDCVIGITHGHFYGRRALDTAVSMFENDNVNCVVFGHSHAPYNTAINGILYFNPGSPTDKRWQKYFTYGKLYVNGNNIRGEINTL